MNSPRETLRAEVLREAFGLDPLENGERENAAQVHEIEALEGELERENREQW